MQLRLACIARIGQVDRYVAGAMEFARLAA
jgi:hypothetical protein